MISDHFPIDLNAQDDGPELDPGLVVRTICAQCVPAEEWPCAAYLELSGPDGMTDELF